MLFSNYVSLSWKNITWCIHRNDMQFWRTYFTCLHIPRVFYLNNTTDCEKDIACARGVIFDIEVDMCYINGMLYHLKTSAHVEGSTYFKEMQSSFQGNHLSLSVWTCVDWRVWLDNVNITLSSTNSLAAYVLRQKSKTELPNTCPKPLSFPQWYLHFSTVFTGFSNETKDPNKCAKKNKVAPPKGGKCRELGPVI